MSPSGAMVAGYPVRRAACGIHVESGPASDSTEKILMSRLRYRAVRMSSNSRLSVKGSPDVDSVQYLKQFIDFHTEYLYRAAHSVGVDKILFDI